ncbi:complement resistance protein TraT [Thalassomonas viridans]|uniref:Complement resistance protein TraT n=1 Tax=Thalassomonas viridans TaxID=137584 RepID=A0AAF0CBQ7_9GAMM|nr:complement resistance protein TraT [Thalassomonas viridans]WDE07948.1 complement resistance protein TraT [Thalassomonas viridans]
MTIDNQATRSKNFILWMILPLFTISGCAAVHDAIQTVVAKTNLNVETKMSETIFLDPVPKEQRTVFIELRNTSDKPGLNIKPAVLKAIKNKGYKVIDNPDDAHYWIQANIRQAGPSDPETAKKMLLLGYEEEPAGTVGAKAEADTKDETQEAEEDSRFSDDEIAAFNLINDTFNTFFSITTDLIISEKAKKDAEISERSKIEVKQKVAGDKTIVIKEKTDRKKYQTRIVSTASQMNLQFDEAQPALISGLSHTLSNLL